MVLEMGFLLVPLVLLYDFIKMRKNAIEKNWKFKMSGYFCFRPYVLYMMVRLVLISLIAMRGDP